VATMDRQFNNFPISGPELAIHGEFPFAILNVFPKDYSTYQVKAGGRTSSIESSMVNETMVNERS
jgi:hypothetical protein